MKILIIHQGYELYGSDRMLIHSIEAFRNKYKNSEICLHLPKQGALSSHIRQMNIVDELKICNLGVLRKADFKRLNFSFLYNITFGLIKTIREVKKYDMVYINSIVIIDYLLLSIFFKGKFILHIHEIPTGLAKYFFSFLINNSKAKVIAISSEVKKLFNRDDVILIPNGVVGYSNSKNTKNESERIRLLIIGRINNWKGQDFFIRSFSLLSERERKCFEIRIVGDVFENQIQYKNTLLQLIEVKRLKDIIKLFPFVENPFSHYQWADVVVVPSLKPEPFGLVAIEGMSAGCAILAADHGGLKDIVIDGQTGWLFVPNSEDDLLAKLLLILSDKKSIKICGAQAFERFNNYYNTIAYLKKIQEII
ncbi:MAG: glycosyltransferase family 4 protein [Breznakibacter sp.]